MFDVECTSPSSCLPLRVINGQEKVRCGTLEIRSAEFCSDNTCFQLATQVSSQTNARLLATNKGNRFRFFPIYFEEGSRNQLRISIDVNPTVFLFSPIEKTAAMSSNFVIETSSCGTE